MEDGFRWDLVQLMLKSVQGKEQWEIKLKRSCGARSNRDFLAWLQILIFILQVMETSEGFSAQEWQRSDFSFRAITTRSVEVGWGGSLRLGGRSYQTLIGWLRQVTGKNEERLRGGPREKTVSSLCPSSPLKNPVVSLKSNFLNMSQ